eukprot:TRINITY_DN505_c0_g1_i2.p2 TRINITY_DN505_c0_g1~~TRINITY_DN505_c0_g1_i2.p2  ORF type:complete len:176 (+),score=91.14 TRINITY_DN505_c0_g1_i2:36-530(+)
MPAKSASKKRASRSSKAGLTFPVARFGNLLKKGRYAKRVSSSAAVFMAAVLEYTCAELLALSAKVSERGKMHSIKPRHLCLAIREDEDLHTLLKDVTIAGGGVPVNVHGAISRKSKKGRKGLKAKDASGKKATEKKKASAAKTSATKTSASKKTSSSKKTSASK